MIRKFKDFLPIYQKAHENKKSQLLHFIGANFLILGIILSIYFINYWILIASIFIAYLLPVIGHQHFEKNKSMRASHPVLCVLGAVFLYFTYWKKEIFK